MNKIKLMLLSLSILAVVGGTLAFKAKTGTQYCTTLPIFDATGNTICPEKCPNRAYLKVGLPMDRICTTTTSGNPVAPCQNGLGEYLDCATIAYHSTIE